MHNSLFGIAYIETSAWESQALGRRIGLGHVFRHWSAWSAQASRGGVCR